LDLFQMIRRRQLWGHWFQLPAALRNASKDESCVIQVMKVIQACFG